MLNTVIVNKLSVHKFVEILNGLKHRILVGTVVVVEKFPNRISIISPSPEGKL